MSALRILFIRHGEKDRTKDDPAKPLFASRKTKDIWHKEADPKRPLTLPARIAAGKLTSALRDLEAVPEIVLTSRYRHAQETAACLPGTSDLFPELNPEEDQPLSLNDLLGRVPDDASTVAVVGHESRLSQLVAAATGERIRPLDPLDAVCVEAPSRIDLKRGRGEIAWRYPVRSHELEALRPKLGSKMTVATLLAGFTFTALLQVVTSKGFKSAFETFITPQRSWTYFEQAVLPLTAALFLSVALTLFVLAIYVCDALTMPAGFWNVGRTGSKQDRPEWDPEVIERDGLVFLHMKYAWTHVFTPAVRFAAVGLLLIAWWRSSWQLAAGFAAAATITLVLCHRAHPRLAAD